MSENSYQVAIVGGGVCGTALLYLLAEYTDLERIVVIEKYDALAKVNSNGRNNSQTLHCGDIETNYDLDKASKVKRAAAMVTNYTATLADRDQIIFKYPKMVLAVGEQECQLLRERYQQFKPVFDTMQLLEKEQLATIEPNVVYINGEMRPEPCIALAVLDEYCAVDFQKLAMSFVEQAKQVSNKQIDLKLNSHVDDIEQYSDHFVIKSGEQRIRADFVVVSAGGHSLLLAQNMGYGMEYSCLPVAGSFYFTPSVLNGKVYTIQNDKLPFAAVHGDPDVLVNGKTRFGPTALVLPLLERYNIRSLIDFFKVLNFDRQVLKTLWDLLKVRDIRHYLFKNILFEVPGLRRWLFLKDVKKIVPSLTLKDIKFASGFGGIRPQLIDKRQTKLIMGEAKINPGNGIVFNMTPSPGASSCLENAEQDMRLIADHLKCHIDEQKLQKILHTS